MIYKVCSKCSERKLLDEFHLSDRGAGGRHAWCKPCVKSYQKNEWVPGSRPGPRKEYPKSCVFVCTNPAWPEWCLVGNVGSLRKDPVAVKLRTINYGSPHEDYEMPFWVESRKAPLVELKALDLLEKQGLEIRGKWVRCSLVTAVKAVNKAVELL